jgi:hypothetical protein
MSPSLERELQMIGILPPSVEIMDDEPELDIYKCLEKGYFNDPRNEYGEVPF